MAMNQQKRERKIGLGVIVWLVLALILLIAFLIKKDEILITLKKTEFFTHLLGSEPAFVENYQLKDEIPTTIIPSNSEPAVIVQDNSELPNNPVVEFQDLSPIDLNSLNVVESIPSDPITSADDLAAVPQALLPSPSDVLIETLTAPLQPNKVLAL